MSPKVLLEKNKERKNRKSEEKETRRRKKNDGCTLSFYVDFFGDSFLKEKKNLFEGRVLFGCNVIQKSSSDIYFSYPCG